MVGEGEGVTVAQTSWWCHDCGGEDGGGFLPLAAHPL
jgi:hypothetical protein